MTGATVIQRYFVPSYTRNILKHIGWWYQQYFVLCKRPYGGIVTYAQPKLCNWLAKHLNIIYKKIVIFVNSIGVTCQNGGTCTPSGGCCCPDGFSGPTCGTARVAGSCTESQDSNVFLGSSRMCSGIWTCTSGSKQCGPGYMVSRIINYQKLYKGLNIKL